MPNISAMEGHLCLSLKHHNHKQPINDIGLDKFESIDVHQNIFKLGSYQELTKALLSSTIRQHLVFLVSYFPIILSHKKCKISAMGKKFGDNIVLSELIEKGSQQVAKTALLI